MFDLSLAELLLIVVVAVVFIGPKELPVVVRGVAKGLRALRNFTSEIRKQFDDLAEESGLKDDIKMIQGDDGNWYESYPLRHPDEVGDTELQNKPPEIPQQVRDDKKGDEQ